MIEFRSVRKQYPDGTTAVEHFDLVIPSRTTTVFVGSSGCGKTTLLRMINRMVDPTAGSVEIDGEDVAAVPPVGLRRRIGYVMQNSGLLPHRKVVDNIATVPLLTGVPKARARERALELMDTVGLDRGLADRYPSQLSGVSSSVSGSPVASPSTRTSSSWTSRSARSTPSCGRICRTSSSGSNENSARPSCS